MRAFPIEKSRRIVLRAGDGDVLPDDLLRVLQDEAVGCGWVRASGVLVEVTLRVYDAATGGLGGTRRIAGPVHALAIEGSVGLDRGELTVGLRAVLARETESGMETLAGEIGAARVVGLEGVIEAYDDLAIGRALDASGVSLFADAGAARYRGDDDRAGGSPAPPRTAAPAREAPSAWGDAIAASAEAEATRPTAPRGSLGGAIPNRLARPVVPTTNDDSPLPEANDIVEHFAFGRCEVLKSDGDRLHLKVGKDGRIKEIALEMLKVTPLESNGPHRRFRLDRKL